MKIIAAILTALIALQHFGFLIMEMFLWEEAGTQVFGLTAELTEQTAFMAANQGLYNGFLATGLL